MNTGLWFLTQTYLRHVFPGFAGCSSDFFFYFSCFHIFTTGRLAAQPVKQRKASARIWNRNCAMRLDASTYEVDDLWSMFEMHAQSYPDIYVITQNCIWRFSICKWSIQEIENNIKIDDAKCNCRYSDDMIPKYCTNFPSCSFLENLC